MIMHKFLKLLFIKFRQFSRHIKRKPFEIFRRLTEHISITFGIYILLYSTLITINQSVFSKSEFGFLTIPFRSILDPKNEKVKITNFIHEGQKLPKKASANKHDRTENIFVFAMDISGSVKSAKEDEKVNKPNWIDELLKKKIKNEKISKILLKPEDKIGSAKKISRFTLAKFQIINLLVELGEQNPETSDKFSLWTIGSKSTLILPKNKNVFSSKLTKENIKKGIEKIYDFKDQKGDANTDFGDFFSQINKKYKEYNDKYMAYNQGNPKPALEIMIISDLVHDVENKYSNKKKKIYMAWNDLKGNLTEISKKNITMDFIVTTKDGILLESKSEKKQIFPYVDREYRYENVNYLLTKRSIDERLNINQFWPVKKVNNSSINFYYRRGFNIAINDYLIDLNEDSKSISFQLSIKIPEKIDSINQENRELKWDLKGMRRGFISSNNMINIKKEELKKEMN